MPLSSAGNRLLHRFIQEYGERKGKSVFYAKESKGGKFAEIVRKHSKKKKKHHS